MKIVGPWIIMNQQFIPCRVAYREIINDPNKGLFAIDCHTPNQFFGWYDDIYGDEYAIIRTSSLQEAIEAINKYLTNNNIKAIDTQEDFDKLKILI